MECGVTLRGIKATRREMKKAANEGLPIRGFPIRSECASHAIVINDGKITVAILPKKSNRIRR